MPVKSGSTPAAFMASRPRRGWQVISVHSEVEAECSQCSFPAARNPVSSKWATSAAAIRSVTAEMNPSRSPAARAVAEDTVPCEIGVPKSSPSAWAVRFLERYWPM